MTTPNRRYDIDWIRVIAIGLLIIYHTAISFQPWGMMIGFITTEKPWVSLWTPMAMLNVWRIPLLFFVSGMGVYFAIQNRNWKQLIMERTYRIWLPFVFGMFCIVPIHQYIWRDHYGMTQSYTPDPAHLWFLGNIMSYVVIFMPLFFYLKRNEDGRLVRGLRKMMSTPLGLLPVIAAFVGETLILKPALYEYYAMTLHGFFLGLLAFFFGFCFVLSGDDFWKMLVKWRWLFLAISIGLFTSRMNETPPLYRLPIETCCWIFSVFAFGHLYLNRPNPALSYLSKAAYPVYILHMIFLYLGSALIFPLAIAIEWQYLLLLVFILVGCFGGYEIIRRVKIVRVLFGIKGPMVYSGSDKEGISTIRLDQ